MYIFNDMDGTYFECEKRIGNYGWLLYKTGIGRTVVRYTYTPTTVLRTVEEPKSLKGLPKL